MINVRLNGRGKHSRRRLVLFALTLVCLLVTGSLVSYRLLSNSQATHAQASALVQITGHVPGLEKQSTLLGSTDPNTPIHVLIGLRPRNAQALKSQADTLAQVRGTRTQRYLNPDQVATVFAPAPPVQSALIAYMQGQGFELAETYRNRVAVGFTGTIGGAERAFGVQINNYRAPSGRNFYAPSSDPGMPTSLAPYVQSIIGLDDSVQYTHPELVEKSVNTRVAAQPAGVTCLQEQPGPTYTYYVPSQIQSAYSLNGLYTSGYQGEGQSVALLELDDYSNSDISAYTGCYGGSSVPISRILVQGGTGQLPSNNAAEVELDMELILSTAPKLAGLRVYEAANTEAGYLGDWMQIINDAVPVVSTSWGSCETLTTPSVYQQENTLFQIAEVQGQTIFAASGDSGTNDCRNNPPTTRAVDDPASQPYVTGVGGTSLSLGPNNSYGTETVWNDGQGKASGGGVSSLWLMPTYQNSDPKTISATYSSGAPCKASSGFYCREVPDVSINADPNVGYPIYCTVALACGAGTTWIRAGGTSAGPPMWAALMALINQKLLHDGYFNAGLLNSYLYAIDQNQLGTHYAGDFHDVTVGTNDTIDSSHIYPATSDYDMATGLGSYNALNLANDVEVIAKLKTKPRVNEASTTWYFAEGSVGGSFTEYLTILNPDPANTATVEVEYLFQSQPAITKQHLVAPSTRSTINVNSDLNVAVNAAQQAISMIVQSVAAGSTPAVPIVAERPMYFNYRGVKSGTDVLGATSITNTTFYFAEGDNRQSGTTQYSTFITVLNPSSAESASVSATFYTGSCGVSGQAACPTASITVPPLYRGTIIPPIHQQFAVKVTSSIGVVVERPMYFTDTIATAGGVTTGAASAVGATTLGSAPGSDWLFAEGYTGPDFQEYLVLANFGDGDDPVNVKLEYTNGTWQIVPVMVHALSQFYFDVNNAYNHPVSGCNCTPTPSVSAEVTSNSISIVAERLMYFHYGPQLLSGATDVVGQHGPASKMSFAFAEGYTNTNFTEYLTLQNPLNGNTVVYITLFADNTVVQEAIQLQPDSRATVNINNLVAPMAAAYPTNPTYLGYNVSMMIESANPIVAERPLYFNYNGDTGGTDVIGFTGG